MNQVHFLEISLVLETCYASLNFSGVEGALVKEDWKKQLQKGGDFALVNPDEKHQYRNKGEKPFKMICGVPKEFKRASNY